MEDDGLTETVPRDAASLILLRADGAVLMGMRGAGHKFMPNRLVFPGGAVDPGDATATAAAEAPAVTVLALSRAAEPPLARALTIAAARELAEETGLSFGCPPVLSGLRYLCRAVTPPGRPIRFNARFLVCDATWVSGTLAGSGELEDLAWWPIEEARALPLAWITGEVMRLLTEFLAMNDAARDAREAFSVCLEQGWSME